MALIGGTFGYWLLRQIANRDTQRADEEVSDERVNLEASLGRNIWTLITGNEVIDFGCGTGGAAIEIAQNGARKVLGVDIQDKWLDIARERARQSGVSHLCAFAKTAAEPADIIISLDAFEHFADPGEILKLMYAMLKPNGCVLASFGPTWYHPLGGHLFSVFPWAHLIFTERALIRWRSDFKTDGAARFSDVDGGLNQLTIRRFERLVAESPFRLAEFEAVPIRKLRHLANRFTREFMTSVVRCKLVPRQSI